MEYICKFLELPELIAAACISSSFNKAAAPARSFASNKLRDKWDVKFNALADRPGVANVVAMNLVDDAVERPREMILAGGTFVIVALLQRFSLTSLLAHNATAILFNLSRLQPIMLQQLTDAGGVTPLISMLLLQKPRSERHAPGEPACGRATKFAAMTLSNALAASSEMGGRCAAELEAALRDAGAVPRLIELLDVWSREGAAGEEESEPLNVLKGIHPAASLLSRMCERGPESSAAVGEAGGVMMAVKLLRHSDAHVRYNAASLLCSLASQPENAIKVREAPGGLTALRSLSECETPQQEGRAGKRKAEEARMVKHRARAVLMNIRLANANAGGSGNRDGGESSDGKRGSEEEGPEGEEDESTSTGLTPLLSRVSVSLSALRQSVRRA